SMVVFVQGVPWKRDYRQFNVRGLDSPDDFKSIEQVLTRRFKRWQAVQHKDSPHKTNTAWTLLPDLLIIDGGKGQLSVAENVLEKFDLLEKIPIAGLAKKREELFIPGRSEPIMLPRRSQGLYLVQRIRDEAHRFAITRHRKRRGKAAFSSVLDTVPGVGPKRRAALIEAFGSVIEVQHASIDEIAAVPGIPRHVAEAIKDLL
ncbi:MAG: excinuclease ABC subunit C, partial [Anaerolineales bacterium]|nr:excinuclease ABC subunit C [Anaerolineales bacterium]